MRILFFSASIGSGHDQIAYTISDYLKRNYSNNNVQILDIIETISPFLSRVILESYLKLLKYAPGIWGLLHNQISKPDNIPDPLKFINNLLAQEVKDRITQFNPDLIVNTYALASTITGVLRYKNLISVPCTTIITDYNLHSYWIAKGIDKYYVASNLLKNILIENNFEEDKIIASGLPVRESFLHAKKRSITSLRSIIGLEVKPTILFIGGSLGLGEILKYVQKIDDKLEDSQLIIACGHNKDLYHKARNLVTKNKLLALPYVENIAEYMQCANIIVTKPGGVTLTEAMVLAKPLALISPIPGQESRNEQYLLNQGVAISLPNGEYDGLILANLLRNNQRLKAMSDLQTLIVNPNASKLIVDSLLTLI